MPRRRPVRRAVLCVCCLVSLALTAAGCAKAKAASVQDGPPLAVPAAPPRVLAPVDGPVAEAPPPPEQPAPEPAGTGRQPTARPAQPARRNPPTATAPAPAPEPPPESVSQSPPVTDQPAAPRAVPTPADAAAERGVRDKLRKAASDLNGVNYQRLSTEGKAQYDQSKRFIDSAETELQKRNYSLAVTMADKAAELATQLLASR